MEIFLRQLRSLFFMITAARAAYFQNSDWLCWPHCTLTVTAAVDEIIFHDYCRSNGIFPKFGRAVRAALYADCNCGS
jgi:hypothetical protein